jgi:apolipoprotein N-acyltransferase
MPLALSLLGVAASAAALWVGTGLHPLWWLTWIAPLPVLACALRQSARAAALAMFAAWAIGGLNLWSFYQRVSVPMPVALLGIAIAAVVFATGGLLMRALVARGRPELAVLALPAVWGAVEGITARVSPHGTFGSLAYSQMDFLPVIQVAAVTGAIGVSFLVLLLPVALAVASSPITRSARVRIVASVGALLLVAIAFGRWRLESDAAVERVTVGLVAGDHPAQPVLVDDAVGRPLVGAYLASVTQLALAGAAIIVMPETAVVSDREGRALQPFADLTEARGVSIVVGTDVRGDAAEHNVAAAFVRGQPPTRYAKRHLLQPVESRYSPGRDVPVLDVKGVASGLAICKDLDFPAVGRDYASRHVALLLVPAWDFAVDGWLHSRMAVLRGVESGFSIARSARNGQLTLSDDRGRIVAEASSSSSPVATLLGTVPVQATPTLYARWGDWFLWVCAAIVLVAIAATVV